MLKIEYHIVKIWVVAFEKIIRKQNYNVVVFLNVFGSFGFVNFLTVYKIKLIVAYSKNIAVKIYVKRTVYNINNLKFPMPMQS